MRNQPRASFNPKMARSIQEVAAKDKRQAQARCSRERAHEDWKIFAFVLAVPEGRLAAYGKT